MKKLVKFEIELELDEDDTVFEFILDPLEEKWIVKEEGEPTDLSDAIQLIEDTLFDDY